MRPRSARLALPLAVVLAAACAGPPSSPSGPASPSAPTSPSASAATPLRVGLGYIPSVQFAQFYLAAERGDYAAAGLDVTLDNRIDPELITLIGQGSVDIGLGDGTSVIPAVAQDIPVRYAATIYARFPSVVLARADSGITTPADLEGRRIGIPGRYGSGWIMLQALLDSAGLSTEDVEIVEYPDFGQAAALQQGQVDAATGFANNEPVQLELAGVDVEVLAVDDIVPLPGPGLVVGAGTLTERADVLGAFVAVTLDAMEDILADPQVGLDATFERVPELAQDRETQLAILEATTAQWQSDLTEERGLGAIDRDGWEASLRFMLDLPDTPVAKPVTVDQLVTEELLDDRP